MSFVQHKRDWEALGTMDPFWAVASHPQYRFGRWDVDALFQTGERVIGEVMESAARLGYPAGRESALDFGCGVGRLTRALATHFSRCYGVDISVNMIEQAKALNRQHGGCEFLVIQEDYLGIFADNSFDLVVSFRVLQHLPSADLIRKYVADLLDVLRPDGLLVFQQLSYIPPRKRLQLRRRLYRALQHLGFRERFLYERLKLTPIRLQYIPEAEMKAYLAAIGATLLEVQLDRAADPTIASRTYFVRK